MRAQSFRAASRCEAAHCPVCRSVVNTIPLDRPREYFETLPEDDPHHVRSKDEKKRRAKERRQEKKRDPRQQMLWGPDGSLPAA